MEVCEFEATSVPWEESAKVRSLARTGSKQVTLTPEADSPTSLHFEINGHGANQAIASFLLSAAALPLARISQFASHLQLLTGD